MRINAAVYRNVRAPKNGTVRVQLGPGRKNYLAGWINIDANAVTGRCDVWADFNHGIPLRDRSVDAIYSYHVIEHLPDLQFHFLEMYRCLKPGGVFRVGGPHGESAIRKYLEGDASWFWKFPDDRQSLGGKLDNFIFCRQEHFHILTFSYISELAVQAGFEKPNEIPCGSTGHPDHFHPALLKREDEPTPDIPHTLVVEGVKSGG
jgi:SAM-dependent methyltransferase